jgi:alpha-L-fucosidase
MTNIAQQVINLTNEYDGDNIWGDVIDNNSFHRQLEQYFPYTSDVVVYDDYSIATYDYSQKQWVLGVEFMFCIGEYQVTLDLNVINFDNQEACLEQKQSPDGSDDWWEFGEDGTILASGDWNTVSDWIVNSWEPLNS